LKKLRFCSFFFFFRFFFLQKKKKRSSFFAFLFLFFSLQEKNWKRIGKKKKGGGVSNFEVCEKCSLFLIFLEKINLFLKEIRNKEQKAKGFLFLFDLSFLL
jgi:hypothetical protein